MGRYGRQELVIGKNAQHMLEKSRVAIVGIGALGTTAASLCVRAGIPVTLFDKDTVELHNLQRQTLFTEKDIGKPKALQAAKYLKTINSILSIQSRQSEINPQTVSLLQDFDLILDCTDSLGTRFLLNDFCVKYTKPWVYSAAISSRGMVFAYIPGSPCFQCIFSSSLLFEACEKCNAVGILNTIPAAIAAIQVTEAMKILTHKPISPDVIAFDIMNMQFQKIHIKRKKDCLCCQKGTFEFL